MEQLYFKQKIKMETVKHMEFSVCAKGNSP